MNGVKKTLQMFNAEELCLLSVYVDMAEPIKTLKDKLLRALHESKDEGMIIIYGTVLCKLDAVTEDEYRTARELDVFNLDRGTEA